MKCFVVERDPDLVGTIGVAGEDQELVADEFTATLDQDRRTAAETCALLLAAVGRRASHAAAFWRHAEKDRCAAAAKRIANQARQRIERSEVIQSGQVSAARQVGSEKQVKPVTGTAKRAAIVTQPRAWRS